MAKLTDVSFNYSGGGIYVFTAKYNDEVWLTTDFMSYDNYGCYDAMPVVVEHDILPDGTINYDGHWKTPSVPLPTWGEIMEAVRDSYGDDEANIVYRLLPANAYLRLGEHSATEPSDNSERLETICEFIEVFEDFLDEKGIVIPNDEKDQDPDASNIYGTDYGNLESRIEELLVRYGVLK